MYRKYLAVEIIPAILPAILAPRIPFTGILSYTLPYIPKRVPFRIIALANDGGSPLKKPNVPCCLNICLQAYMIDG